MLGLMSLFLAVYVSNGIRTVCTVRTCVVAHGLCVGHNIVQAPQLFVFFLQVQHALQQLAMPPKGKDTKAKGEAGKGKDKVKTAPEEKAAKTGAGKLKPATAINVRHILVRLVRTLRLEKRCSGQMKQPLA